MSKASTQIESKKAKLSVEQLDARATTARTGARDAKERLRSVKEQYKQLRKAFKAAKKAAKAAEKKSAKAAKELRKALKGSKKATAPKKKPKTARRRARPAVVAKPKKVRPARPRKIATPMDSPVESMDTTAQESQSAQPHDE